MGRSDLPHRSTEHEQLVERTSCRGWELRQMQHCIHCVQHDIRTLNESCRHLSNRQPLTGPRGYAIAQRRRQPRAILDVVGRTRHTPAKAAVDPLAQRSVEMQRHTLVWAVVLSSSIPNRQRLPAQAMSFRRQLQIRDQPMRPRRHAGGFRALAAVRQVAPVGQEVARAADRISALEAQSRERIVQGPEQAGGPRRSSRSAPCRAAGRPNLPRISPESAACPARPERGPVACSDHQRLAARAARYK